MFDQGAHASFDAPLLAEAFPADLRTAALRVGAAAARQLLPYRPAARFAVDVAGEQILIPDRLHFGSHRTWFRRHGEAWLLARALHSRSLDGYHRQRAARDLLADLRPWTAPFIVALIGGYVVEILDDIRAGLTPEREQLLAAFIAGNPAYWATTRQRMISYWNAYYRGDGYYSRAWRRADYVGFRLVERLDAATAELRVREGPNTRRLT